MKKRLNNNAFLKQVLAQGKVKEHLIHKCLAPLGFKPNIKYNQTQCKNWSEKYLIFFS